MIPNKNLGQHFLKDKTVINNILQCCPDLNQIDAIIEIGPGAGALTFELIKIEKPLILMEKDQRSYELLKELTPHFYLEDILKLDINKVLDQLKFNKVWVVSNLPYNISTKILTKLIPIEQIKFMTLMFQKEVGEKTVCIDPNSFDNSSLFMFTNLFFHSKKIQIVQKGAFSPPPKVLSIVNNYIRKDIPVFPTSRINKIEKINRIIFSNPRKKMSSKFKNTNELDSLILEFLKNNNLNDKRSERLTFEETINIIEFYLDRNS